MDRQLLRHHLDEVNVGDCGPSWIAGWVSPARSVQSGTSLPPTLPKKDAPTSSNSCTRMQCSKHRFCVGREGSLIYCYGSTKGCLYACACTCACVWGKTHACMHAHLPVHARVDSRWGKNDCITDADCSKYSDVQFSSRHAIPKYTDGPNTWAGAGKQCPHATEWRADACGPCHTRGWQAPTKAPSRKGAPTRSPTMRPSASPTIGARAATVSEPHSRVQCDSPGCATSFAARDRVEPAEKGSAVAQRGSGTRQAAAVAVSTCELHAISTCQ